MYAFLLSFMLAASPVVAPPAPTAPTAHQVLVLDGDTIRADIDLGFDLILRDQTIRIYNFDAWEISHHRATKTVTDAEIAKGQLAKAALEKLLDARVTVAESGHKDPYGRRSLWIYADGKEVGATMRAAGHERK